MSKESLKIWSAYTARSLTEAVLDWRSAIQRLIFQPLVYLVVFGGVVGNSSAISTDGNYARIVAPGIIAIVVMNAAMAVIGGMFVTGYYFRVMETWLSGPISLRGFLGAQIAGATAISTLSGTVAIILVWIVLGFPPSSPLRAFSAIVIGGASFALIFAAAFSLPRTPNRTQGVLSFVMMPMMFFGCTFYSWDSLKAPWNLLALLMPTTYLSEALRAAYSAANTLSDTALLAGGCLVLIFLAIIAERIFQWRFRDFPW